MAVFLIAMAFTSFLYVGRDLSGIFESENAMLVILLMLRDLFIAIIIVELLQTAAVFIREEQVDIRMILGAGLTAMVRKVLVFGVEAVEITEMVIVVALIIALTLAIVMFTRYTCARIGLEIR
ncbi:MAG: phosphate-starvation-inducible PsiE family protein [Methanocellales archaeon]|nr:phosphate-starvation-inducible PsiE family protein [Methanocellales archaeon]